MSWSESGGGGGGGCLNLRDVTRGHGHLHSQWLSSITTSDRGSQLMPAWTAEQRLIHYHDHTYHTEGMVIFL